MTVVPPRSMPTKSSCRCASCGPVVNEWYPTAGGYPKRHSYPHTAVAFHTARHSAYAPYRQAVRASVGIPMLCPVPPHSLPPLPGPLVARVDGLITAPPVSARSRQAGFPTYRTRHCCVLSCCTVARRTRRGTCVATYRGGAADGQRQCACPRPRRRRRRPLSRRKRCGRQGVGGCGARRRRGRRLVACFVREGHGTLCLARARRWAMEADLRRERQASRAARRGRRRREWRADAARRRRAAHGSF